MQTKETYKVFSRLFILLGVILLLVVYSGRQFNKLQAIKFINERGNWITDKELLKTIQEAQQTYKLTPSEVEDIKKYYNLKIK
jgi:hypothetical protein